MINDIFIGSLQKQNRSENKGGGNFYPSQNWYPFDRDGVNVKLITLFYI